MWRRLNQQDQIKKSNPTLEGKDISNNKGDSNSINDEQTDKK